MAAESEFDLWRIITTVVTTFTAGGVLAVVRWMLGIASKQREQDSWRKNVDSQLAKGDAEISDTHDAVIELKTNVEFLKDGLGEVRADQKSILKKLTELISRPW